MEFYVWDSAPKASFYQLLILVFRRSFENVLFLRRNVCSFSFALQFYTLDWLQSVHILHACLNVQLLHIYIYVLFVVVDLCKNCEAHSSYVHCSLGWKGGALLWAVELSGSILLVHLIGVFFSSQSAKGCVTDCILALSSSVCKSVNLKWHFYTLLNMVIALVITGEFTTQEYIIRSEFGKNKNRPSCLHQQNKLYFVEVTLE